MEREASAWLVTATAPKSEHPRVALLAYLAL